MALLAKSSIVLTSVSDAYSVSLQPSNIVISADCYGDNARLDNAFTVISLYCGDKHINISSGEITGSSLWELSGAQNTDAVLTVQDKDLCLRITHVDNQPYGWRDIAIHSDSGQVFNATFSYTIVRETSMLDWILDWNKQLTQITGYGVATPNAFVGGAGDIEGSLSGVYIGGRDNGHPYKPGIYGIKNCNQISFTQGNIEGYEIFRLNEAGGMIAGWDIQESGLFTQTETGALQILSNGTIRHLDNEEGCYWALNSDGTGEFARGSIVWDAAGNVTLNNIQANSGQIGGWELSTCAFHSSSILISGKERFIGVRNIETIGYEPSKDFFVSQIKKSGGVYLDYTSGTDFGIKGYAPRNLLSVASKLVFSIGSANQIAGWNFDHQALYLGAKYNTQGTYAGEDGVITLGTNGLRGTNWYIDQNGDIDFVNGRLHFNKDGGIIAGWAIAPNSLESQHIVLKSNSLCSGVFLSPTDIRKMDDPSILISNDSGGIIIKSTDTTAQIAGYARIFEDDAPYLIFNLTSTGASQIGAWNFGPFSFWRGTQINTTNVFTNASGDITIGTQGIRGYKWCLNADGSGQLAGGAISWKADGSLTLDLDVTVSWADITGKEDVDQKLTYIGAKGLYSGHISADNIDAGTISTASIQSTGKWVLNHDGSGMLAGGAISWKADGSELIVDGNINAKTGKLGAWEINQHGQIVSSKDYTINANSIVLDASLNGGINVSSGNITEGGKDTLTSYLGFGSNINLSPSMGRIEARFARSSYTSTGGQTINAPYGTNSVAYLSPNGVFANLAGIECDSSYISRHRAAICGLGFADMNKDSLLDVFNDEYSASIGVYGRAYNKGTAPAYGGYFKDLKACGLILNRIFIHDGSSDNGTQLQTTDSFVFGLCNKGVTKKVFLPSDGLEGRVIFVKQAGKGTMRIYPTGGQYIYDDTSENSYYDFHEGQMGILVFGVWNRGNVPTQTWSVNRLKY